MRLTSKGGETQNEANFKMGLNSKWGYTQNEVKLKMSNFGKGIFMSKSALTLSIIKNQPKKNNSNKYLSYKILPSCFLFCLKKLKNNNYYSRNLYKQYNNI